jgi:hypothetical protein
MKFTHSKSFKREADAIADWLFKVARKNLFVKIISDDERLEHVNALRLGTYLSEYVGDEPIKKMRFKEGKKLPAKK